MFTGLHDFENAKVFDGDDAIYIYTPRETLVYRIFAAYEGASLHLLANADMTNEYYFEEYLEGIFANVPLEGRKGFLKEGVEVTRKDRIITLSTCTEPSDVNYRYLVQGVLWRTVPRNGE